MKNFNYYTDNKLKANIKDYRDGKRDFSVEELNEIKLYILKYKDIIDNTNFFTGYIKEYKVVSCFAEDSFYEELHTRMINSYSADIAIIVILSDKKIIFRKNPDTCKLDLCRLAHVLSDGECVETSSDLAIGKLTNNFINLTKKFIKCI